MIKKNGGGRLDFLKSDEKLKNKTIERINNYYDITKYQNINYRNKKKEQILNFIKKLFDKITKTRNDIIIAQQDVIINKMGNILSYKKKLETLELQKLKLTEYLYYIITLICDNIFLNGTNFKYSHINFPNNFKDFQIFRTIMEEIITQKIIILRKISETEELPKILKDLVKQAVRHIYTSYNINTILDYINYHDHGNNYPILDNNLENRISNIKSLMNTLKETKKPKKLLFKTIKNNNFICNIGDMEFNFNIDLNNEDLNTYITDIKIKNNTKINIMSKIIPIDKYDNELPKNNLIEIKIMNHLTKIVSLNKNPHFPIMVGYVWKYKYNYLIFYEKIEKNLTLFFTENDPSKMSLDLHINILDQILIACISYHSLTGLLHGNMHPNNISYYKVKEGGYFHYNIYNKDIYIKNLGYIWILNNFSDTIKLPNAETINNTDYDAYHMYYEYKAILEHYKIFIKKTNIKLSIYYYIENLLNNFINNIKHNYSNIINNNKLSQIDKLNLIDKNIYLNILKFKKNYSDSKYIDKIDKSEILNNKYPYIIELKRKEYNKIEKINMGYYFDINKLINEKINFPTINFN